MTDELKDRNARDDKASVDKRVGAVEKKQAWYSDAAAAAVGAVVAAVEGKLAL